MDWNKSKLNTLKLSDDPTLLSTDKYFRSLTSGQKCFKTGTNFDKTASDANKCTCNDGYYGIDCGIPDAVWYGHYAGAPHHRKKLKIRTKSRRLIHALPVNHEFDFFEARVKTLQDVVDAFIIQESNYTTFGTPKDLHFLDKFKDGWLSEVQSKILWVLLPFFSDKGKENGKYYWTGATHNSVLGGTLLIWITQP